MSKKNKLQENKQNDLDKPDPETLHTTDPQEHMEGPVSSLVQDVKKTGERNKPVMQDKKNEQNQDSNTQQQEQKFSEKNMAPEEKSKSDLSDKNDVDGDEDENHYDDSVGKN